jgi:hypothetical protein
MVVRERKVARAARMDDKQNMANLQHDDLDVTSCPEKERLVALTYQGRHAKSWSPQNRRTTAAATQK